MRAIKHLWYRFKSYLGIYEGWVLIQNNYQHPLLLKFKNGQVHNADGPAYYMFNMEDQYPPSPNNIPTPISISTNGIANIISSKAGIVNRYYLEGNFYHKEDWEKELLIRKMSGMN